MLSRARTLFAVLLLVPALVLVALIGLSGPAGAASAPRSAAVTATKAPAKKPVAKKAVAKPVAKKAVAKKPVAKPVAKKPVAKKPVATATPKVVVPANKFVHPQVVVTDYNTATVRVSGTAQDPRSTSAVLVRLRADGKIIASAPTDAAHHYAINVTMPANEYEVCAESLNVARTKITSMGCFNLLDQPTATWSQVQQIIHQVDPTGSVQWDRSITVDGGDGVYGVALPWYGIVQLDGDRLPLGVARDVVLHEWSHVLQYRSGGSTAQGWLDVLAAADKAIDRPYRSDDDYAIEHEADCMAQLQGASFLFYGCTPALLPLARAILAQQ